MGPLFWDTSLARIDLQRDADSVLARVLEFGKLRDVAKPTGLSTKRAARALIRR